MPNDHEDADHAGSDDEATRVLGRSTAPPSELAPAATHPPAPATTTSVPVAPPATNAAGELIEGTVLSNTLRIERLLGHGGMGEVYLAKHTFQGTMHAIKRIAPHIASDETYLSLFKREAQVLVKLRSESIVRYDMSFIDADGSAYLVMEFLDGPSLGNRIRDLGPMSPDDLGVLGKRLAAGLQSAHEQGVFHRDIAPDNVILHGGGVDGGKIIDFGIAREESTGEATILGGSFAGKPRYAAPEQFHLFGGKIDGRTDIYSLGLVFAYALLGRPLLDATNEFDARDQRKDPPNLSAIPEKFRPVLARMLVPDPADRAQSMDEVIALIARHVEGIVPGAPAQAGAPGGGGTNRFLLAGVALLAVIAIGAAAFVVLRPPADNTTQIAAVPGVGTTSETAPAADYTPLWRALDKVNASLHWSLFTIDAASPTALTVTQYHLSSAAVSADREMAKRALTQAGWSGATIDWREAGIDPQTSVALEQLWAAFDGALSPLLLIENKEGGGLAGANLAGIYPQTELFQAYMTYSGDEPVMAYGNFVFPNGDLLHEWADREIDNVGPGFDFSGTMNNVGIPWPLAPNYNQRADSHAILVDHGSGLGATVMMVTSPGQTIDKVCLKGRSMGRFTSQAVVTGRIADLARCAQSIKGAGGKTGVAVRPFLSMPKDQTNDLPGFSQTLTSQF